MVVVTRASNHAAGFDTGHGELRQHLFGVFTAYLDHRPQLFREQRVEGFYRLIDQPVELDFETGVRGKSHLQQRHQQATVAAVVVSQQLTVAVQTLDHFEKRFQIFRVVHIGALIAHLAIDLRQRRAAKAILAITQVDQDQIRLILLQVDLRRQRRQRVGHRCKACHHQRQRRGNALLFGILALLPRSAHGHRVLAHRYSDAKRRA